MGLAVLTEVRLRPWRRAPLLLLRRPGVLVALAAASLVTALPLASGPLVLSSSQGASIARQVDDSPPAYSGVRVSAPLNFRSSGGEVAWDVAQARAGHARRAATEVPNLGPMRVTFAGGAELAGSGAQGGILVSSRGAQQAPRNMILLARDGLADHVDIVDGGSGEGVWLPDTIAEYFGIDPGDRVELTYKERSVEVPVVAIHRDLREVTLSPFWESIRTTVQTLNIGGDREFPAAVLVDSEAFFQIADSLQLYADHMIEFPLADPSPSRQLAGETVAALPAMREELSDDELFTAEPEVAYYPRDLVEVVSELPRFVNRADLVESTIRVPVSAAAAAGAAVGLVVVGAAALLWTRRRQRELVVLAAHGVSPAALGIKGVLEAAPAVAIGCAAGWLLAHRLTVTVGPSPVLSSQSLPVSAALVAAAGLLGLVVVGDVAAMRCRRLADAAVPGRVRRLVAVVPWEVGLVAAAAAAWAWLDTSTVVAGEFEQQTGAVVRLPPAVFVTPILAAVAAVLLLARIGLWWLRRRALSRSPRSQAVFLAWRRIGRDRTVAVALVAATAVPVALAGYGAVVARSAETTLQAQAETFVGADVIIDLSEPEPAPHSLNRLGQVTDVVRIDGFRLGSGRTSLLLVDTDTFADVVDVGDLLVGGDFEQLLSGLDRSEPPAPVLATPTASTGVAELSFRDIEPIPVRVTTVPELPARQSGYPLVIAPRQLLGGQLPFNARHQLWVTGDDPEAIRAAAERDLATVERIRLAAEQYQGTMVEPVTYTFAYLVAVSVLTAIVLVVGLLLHLESRSVAHRRAYILLRRMGMRPRTHRAALLWELAGLLTTGAGLGTAIAALLAYLLSARFDPRPQDLPETVIAVPTVPFMLIAVAVVATAVGASVFAHARAARANAGEVLREVA